MSEEFLAFPIPGGRWSRRDRMRVSIVGAVVIDGRTQRSAPTRAIVTCHPIDNGCTSVVPLIRHGFAAPPSPRGRLFIMHKPLPFPADLEGDELLSHHS